MMTNQPKKRVRAYIRVSDKSQVELTSLLSQERECKLWIEGNGFTLESISREVYTGAELFDRPQLAKDRQDFKRGLFDVYLIYSTDRLSRNPVHLSIIAEECERAEVELAFVSETFDNSMESNAIRYMKGFAGQIERERIRERMLRGKKTIAQLGRVHNSGTDLYGYRRDRERHVRLIYEPEAEIVRRVFDEVCAGRPLRAIARGLNDEGILPSSRGKRLFENNRESLWHKSQLLRMIRNEGYKGESYAWKWKTTRKGAKMVRMESRDRSEWIKLPDNVTPPIVSPATWQRANDALDRNVGDSTRNQNSFYLLRGLIVCSVCGERLYSEKTKGYRRYRCSSRQKRQGSCGALTVLADRIEREVWQAVKEMIVSPETLSLRLRDEKPTDNSKQIEILQSQIGKIEAGQSRLIRKLRECESEQLAGMIEEELSQAEREKASIQSRLIELRRSEQHQRATKSAVDSLTAICAAMKIKVDNFTEQEKRKALEALQIKVFASGQDFDFKVEI